MAAAEELAVQEELLQDGKECSGVNDA